MFDGLSARTSRCSMHIAHPFRCATTRVVQRRFGRLRRRPSMNGRLADNRTVAERQSSTPGPTALGTAAPPEQPRPSNRLDGCGRLPIGGPDQLAGGAARRPAHGLSRQGRQCNSAWSVISGSPGCTMLPPRSLDAAQLSLVQMQCRGRFNPIDDSAKRIHPKGPRRAASSSLSVNSCVAAG